MQKDEDIIMGIIGLLFMAIGLSMDAFAVSVCKGLSMRESNFKSWGKNRQSVRDRI